MKLVLGTANFKKIYGINNHRINNEDLKRIINLCKKKKINFFDTAESYNNYKKLSLFLDDKSKVITKIKFNNKEKYTKKKIDNLVKKILEDLKIKKLHGLLIHNVEGIYEDNFRKFYEKLKSKKIKKIGFSCYKISEIKYLLKNYKFEILQFPFNLFDQRIANEKNILKDLKKRKIEIHIRSIFLQGLLLKQNLKLTPYFLRWKRLFQKMDKLKKLKKISSLELVVNFLKYHNFYNRIIVGIDNPYQLIEFIELYFKTKKITQIDYKQFSNKNYNLILPNLWDK